MHMSEAHTKNMNVNDQVSVTLTEEGVELCELHADDRVKDGAGEVRLEMRT